MVALQIFSGAGTGLLLGLLLGLSSSPVVGLVVGALAALLASLVGIRVHAKEAADAPAEPVSAAQRKLAALRSGVFGFTCVLSLLGGIYLRTHNALSAPPPTLLQQVDELKALGFSPQEARKLAVLHTLDAGSPVAKSAQEAKVSDAATMLRNTTLFADSTDSCERLSVDRYKDMAAAMAAYQAMDKPVLLRIATAINQQLADEKARMALLRSVVEALCVGR